MPKTAKTITESEAALQDAQREHLRISNELAECDAELVRLDLHNHVQAATASLDAAVDAGDTASIQAAATARVSCSLRWCRCARAGCVGAPTSSWCWR